MRAVCDLPVGNVPDCGTCCPPGTCACCRTSKRGSGHVQLYPLGIFPTMGSLDSAVAAPSTSLFSAVTPDPTPGSTPPPGSTQDREAGLRSRDLTRGESLLYATASRGDEPCNVDFLPTSVDDQEQFRSAGMMSSELNRREGRPAEHESTLLDLSNRPMCGPGRVLRGRRAVRTPRRRPGH